MDIRYGPELLEEAVTRELLRREAAGDGAWLAAFHREADLLYLVPTRAAQDAAFERLHAEYFRKLGFAAPVERAVADFPSFRGTIAEVRIDPARVAGEEEADLLADAASGRRAVRVRLRTARFEDGAALEGFLRQELRHVADLLRPSFAYRPVGRLAERPVEENVVRARLRLLWNLAVAGDLARRGRRGAATREEWERLAGRLYPGLTAEARTRVVEALWGAETVTYPELARFAARPGDLLAYAGVSGAAACIAGAAPGTSCPLCGFSTFDWTADWNRIPPAAVEAIRADFPGWGPDQGACRQCSDVYAVRSPQSVVLGRTT